MRKVDKFMNLNHVVVFFGLVYIMYTSAAFLAPLIQLLYVSKKKKKSCYSPQAGGKGNLL